MRGGILHRASWGPVEESSVSRRPRHPCGCGCAAAPQVRHPFAMAAAMTRLLAARVAGQHGLVSRAQALAGGVTPKAIECHLRRGRWVVVHPGVYLTTPGRDEWELRAVAALLWAGRGAALWGTSAAHSAGLVRAQPDPIRVVVPATRNVQSAPGVLVSRSRHLPERVDPKAWPHRVTVSHTVFDVAASGSFDVAITLAARALDLDLATRADLLGALERRPRQPHRKLLLEALDDVSRGSESAAEVRYVRGVERAHGLPVGRRQAPLTDALVPCRSDVAYDGYDVLVEVDGRVGHSSWAARQRDGQRDRRAAAKGRVCLRCYWVDLVPTGCTLAMEVGAVLRARGWAGRVQRCGRSCLVDRGASER